MVMEGVKKALIVRLGSRAASHPSSADPHFTSAAVTGFELPARSQSLPEAPRPWAGVRKPSGNEPARGGHPVQRALWGFEMLGRCNAGAVIAGASTLGLI